VTASGPHQWVRNVSLANALTYGIKNWTATRESELNEIACPSML